jgi:cytochrome c-type biogenesis protein CcmH/NrfF
VLLLIGALLGSAAVARADTSGPPAEHEDEIVKARGHSDDAGWAHKFRPDSPTAASLMRELVCMCGGCKRENLHDCKCGWAAMDRQKVLQMLALQDLTTDKGRIEARRAVLGAFIREYGGEQVLVAPRSSATWLLPYLAVAGGLVLIVFVGRGLVKRGSATPTGVPSAGTGTATDYDEKLDDELRDTD